MASLKEILFKNKHKSKQMFIISAVMFFLSILYSIKLIADKDLYGAISVFLTGLILYYIFQNLANTIYNQNEIIKVLKKEIESNEK